MNAKRRALAALLACLCLYLAVRGQRHLELRDFVLDGLLFLAAAVVVLVLLLARYGDGEPLPWPNNWVSGKASPSHALARGRLQRGLLIGCVLLAIVAFASLGENRFTLRGALCWWGAVVAWLLAVAEGPQVDRSWWKPRLCTLGAAVRRGAVVVRARWPVIALLGILAVAVFFRVYRIAELPTEPQSDHLEASLDVWDILHGEYRIFFTRNTGREATQFYLTAALAHVFGYGFSTLKLTMALVGAMNVLPMYWLGRELWDRRFGLLAAFLMAMSYWHVIVSRIGWRIVLAPLWTTATLWLVLRAFRTERRNAYLAAGLALGLGLYGYMSFRVTPLLLAVLCALKVLLDRGPGFRIGRFVVHAGLMVATAALVFLPMLRYMYDEPRMLWYRVLTRTTDLEVTVAASPQQVFAGNVKRAYLMFNWTGGSGWVESVPFRPVLDYVTAGLLVMGAACLLYLLLVKRHPLALYLLVSSFVLLLPSTLSLAFPFENPSNIRASGVIPVVLLVAAVPVYWLGRRIALAVGGRAGTLVSLVVIGVLLWQVARLNWRTYFVEYDEHYRRSAWNTSDMAGVIGGFGKSLGSIYDAYIICTPHWVDHRGIGLILGDVTWNNLLMDVSEAETHLADRRNRLYLYNPVNSTAEAWLHAKYPNGQLLRFTASNPDKDFMVYFAPAQP